MGLFNLFEKKSCSVCGGEIGLLGNRKLEDGNLCKSCAAKLSPWFSERRGSTVAQIREQLHDREENQKAVAQLHVTRSLGERTKLLIDEDAGKFVVTSARSLTEANPDVLDFSMVTGADLDIDEDRDEAQAKDAQNHYVSYDPPRYNYSYDFYVVIQVNHPWFNEIRFRLNPSSVTTTASAVPERHRPDPKRNAEYIKYEKLGREMVELLTRGRQQSREEAAPKKALTCPACGATDLPDAQGRCQYCGKPLA